MHDYVSLGLLAYNNIHMLSVEIILLYKVMCCGNVPLNLAPLTKPFDLRGDG